MQSPLQHADPNSDPHDAIVALLRDHAPRQTSDLAKLNIAPGASGHTATSSAPAVEPPLRLAPTNDNSGDTLEPEPRPRKKRGVLRVLLSMCAGAAVTIAWQAYGDDARQTLSSVVPQLFASATAPSANGAEPQDATAQADAAQPAEQTAPAQAAAEAPSAPATQSAAPATEAAAPAAPPQSAAPAQAAPELAQTVEAMSQEIATLKQTVEDLKAGQQQLTRDLAKAAEHETRRKPAPSAKSTAKPASQPPVQRTAAPVPPAARPAAAYVPPPSPQGRTYPQGYPSQGYPTQGSVYSQGTTQRDAYIPPPPPARLPPEPGFNSAPRPPLPLQ
jgi:hypothetical protein